MKRFAILVLSLFASFASAEESRKSVVAVLPFTARTLDADAVEGIASALASELFNTGRFRVMERSQMDQILKEQGFQQSGVCDGSECAVQMGRLLSVDQIVLGTIGKVGNTYSVTARIVGVGSGEVIRSVTRNSRAEVDAILTDVVPSLARDLAGIRSDAPAMPVARTVPRQVQPAAQSPTERIARPVTVIAREPEEPPEPEAPFPSHEGVHLHLRMTTPAASFSEGGLGARLQLDVAGFGLYAGYGLGAYLFSLDAGKVLPTLGASFGWGRSEVGLTWTAVSIATAPGSPGESANAFMGTYFRDIGQPGGFGLYAGVGIVQVYTYAYGTWSDGSTVDPATVDYLPMACFAVTYELF